MGSCCWAKGQSFQRSLNQVPQRGSFYFCNPYSTGPCGLARVPLGCRQAGVVAALF